MAISRNLLSACAIAALAVATSGTAVADDAGRSADLYELCAYCHGPDAAGNADLGAPPIAGMSQWYIEKQLRKFRSGARGAHVDDLPGLRMRPMSRTLREDEIAVVAAFVADMKRIKQVPTLTGGDAVAGATAYALCSTCHGASGEGNKGLNAPELTGTADWYLLTQIENYKAGVRAADPSKDPEGALMRPFALMLADEQATKNVIAHIMTLSK